MGKLQPVVPKPEHLMQVTITLSPALNVGMLAAGTRRIISITGGHFTGKTLAGEVLPGGAD